MAAPQGNQYAKGCKTSGRPKIILDEKILKGLAEIQCTNTEMAAVMGCSVKVLTEREEYYQIIKDAREVGKKSLRRALWDTAVIKRSAPILIWLSKQYLGMKEPDQEMRDFAKSAFEKYLEIQKKSAKKEDK